MCSVAQSCPTFCDPMDCSLPGSSVHGIFQARILEWVAISYFRGSSWPRNWTHVSCVSCIGRQTLYHYRHLGSQNSNTLRHLYILLLFYKWHFLPLMKTTLHLTRQTLKNGIGSPSCSFPGPPPTRRHLGEIFFKLRKSFVYYGRNGKENILVKFLMIHSIEIL